MIWEWIVDDDEGLKMFLKQNDMKGQRVFTRKPWRNSSETALSS